MDRRDKITLSLLLATSICFLVFLQIIENNFFLYDDNVDQFLPWYYHNWVSLFRQGELPLINFHQYLGTPHLSAAQPAVLYPPAYLAVCTSLLLFSHPYHAIDIFVSLHLIIATLGMYVLLRRLAIIRPMAVAASLLWITYPYIINISKSWSFRSSLAAYLPLDFYFLESLLRRPGWKPILGLAATKTLLFFAGYPQHSLMVVIFEIMLIGSIAVAKLYHQQGSALYPRLLSYAVALILAGLLTTPLSLPLLNQALHSAERAAPLARHIFLNNALDLNTIFRAQFFLFTPRVIAQADSQLLHAGIFSVASLFLLTLPAVRQRFKRSRASSYFVLAIAALFLSTPFYAIFYSIPLLNRLTGPHKYFTFFLFFLTVILAGTLQAAIKKIPPRAFYPLTSLILLSTVINILLIYRFPTDTRAPQKMDIPPHASTLGPVVNEKRGRAFTYLPQLPLTNYQYLTHDFATLFEKNHFSGYDPLRLLTTHELTLGLTYEGTYKKDLDQPLLDYLSYWSVKYLITDHLLETTRFPQLSLISWLDNVAIYENKNSLPYVYDPAKPHQEIPHQFGVNKIRIHPVGSDISNLIINVAALPGYVYRLDSGPSRPIAAATGPIRLPVPPHTREITVEYRDNYFLAGVIISALTLAALLAFPILTFIRRRRIPATSPAFPTRRSCSL